METELYKYTHLNPPKDPLCKNARKFLGQQIY